MEHCISDHHCFLLWAASSQWAFCLIRMCTEQLWSVRDLAILKFSHKITMLHVCHLPMPQSPARDSASVTISLRGTGTWTEPLAAVSLLEASGFPPHSHSLTFGPGADSWTKVLTRDWASCRQYKWPQHSPMSKSDWPRSPEILGGLLFQQFRKRGSSPYGEPPSLETEVQTTLEQGKQCQPHPFLASPHLEVNSFGCQRNLWHPKEAAVWGCADLQHDLQFHRRPIPI